jgi:hypothetical protein
VLLLTGCGHSGVAPMTWAGSVCQALKPWRDSITALNAQAAHEMASAKTPEQARTNLLRLLAGAQQASEQARAQVAKAGVPAVDGGQTIADRFVASLAMVRDAYDKAHDTIAALATRDAKKFYDAVSAAVGELNREYGQAGLDTGKLASAELRKDFAEAPGCATG